jgi:hypothetical protein
MILKKCVCLAQCGGKEETISKFSGETIHASVFSRTEIIPPFIDPGMSVSEFPKIFCLSTMALMLGNSGYLE